jgi:hypothetical protein
MPENVAIFVVRQDGQSRSVDPVVIVHYGGDQRFTTIPSLNSPLPSRDRKDEDFDKVEADLYKPGTPVALFSGGEKLGTATVVSSNVEGRNGACVDLSGVISYRGTKNPLLAANAVSEIPGHTSTRRPATPVEALRLRQLAQEWLVDYGLARSLVQHGRMQPVISTVLRPGAGHSLVGRYDVISKRAIHRLFVIAEQQGGRYHLTLANLEVQHDLEDGTDKAEREYVDQLDINNDGRDEVITSTSHYESYAYEIWEFYDRQKDKGWRHSYTGTGGGC